jgi:ABC-2 type transport system permease protein
MNLSLIRTIALKDLKEVQQNKGAWITATVVPLVFLVLLPLVIILVPDMAGLPMGAMFAEQSPVTMMMRNVPSLADQLAGLNEMQVWVVLATGSMLAPFFLIMPLMFSSIVGAESFAGEKERKTLEALIYTPATDSELFLGKVAASVVPAVLLAWLSFIVYAVVVNTVGWHIMGRIWFPTPLWWPLMLWVTPAVATLGMALTVLISARVSTFMEAYQMSGSLVVLVLALVAGQVTGVLYLSVPMALLVGLLIWGISAVLLWFGIRTFSRTALLARL